jgi:hypothetical protein
VYAQTPADEVFSFPLSGETLPRYSGVCARLAAHPIITGTFTQTKTLTRIQRSLVSGGNFIFDTARGIVWETLKPFPSVMAVGQDYIVQSLAGGKKTKTGAAGNETFMRFSETMRAVFTGDSRLLRENFKNYFTGQPAAGGASNWTLGLIPTDTSLQAFAAALVLTGDSVIRTITLYEKAGDVLRYELSGHSFPAELSPREKAFFSADE